MDGMDSGEPTTLGDQLAYLLKRAEWYHHELAAASGVSTYTISHIVNGVVRAKRGPGRGPQRSIRARLARALMKRFDELVRTRDLIPDEADELKARTRSLLTAPIGPATRPNGQESATAPAHVPALLGARRAAARATLTSFVGRVREQVEVRRLLHAARLLTLTGAGGCGKTRLALAVAGEVGADYPDGVWLVELAELADPSLVPQAVAEALGLREEPGQPILVTLTTYLTPTRLLLVLDNCEHLAAACAELVTVLLAACPQLRVLTTSRAPLEAPAETIYRVPSLALPDVARRPSSDDLLAFDAIGLFVERARARQPDFALTPRNEDGVMAICLRLDGIALALELAAARVGVLAVDDIAAGLDDCLRILTGGPRDALPRHQAMQATLDWSYDLLEEPERVLLRRLSVFAGGWTLQAAEAVCTGGVVAQEDVLDLLTALVNKSLAQMEERNGRARYRLLETVRQYGQQHVTASGEAELVRERHRDWYVRLAEEAEPALRGAAQIAWLERLEAERDNLRAVLDRRRGAEVELPHGAPDRFTAPDDQSVAAWADGALRVATALWRFWEIRAPLSEGRRWLEEAIARTGAPPALYARVLAVAGRLAHLQGDHDAATARFEEAMALAREIGDERTTALALYGLGSVALQRGDAARADAWFRQSLSLWEGLDDTWGRANALDGLGGAAHNRDKFAGIAQRDTNLERATALYEESLTLRRPLGDAWGMARTLLNLGDVAMDQERYPRAMRRYEEGLRLARDLNDRLGIAQALFCLGVVAYARGDGAGVIEPLTAALALSRQMGARERTALWLMYLGDALGWLGDDEQAATCYRESEMLHRELGNGEGAAFILTGDAWLALSQGDDVRAAALAEESIAELHALGNEVNIVFALYFLGSAVSMQGDHGRALALHREGLQLAREHFRGWFRRMGMFSNLFGVARALDTLEQAERAARVLGAASKLNKPYPVPMGAWEQSLYDRTVASLRAHLGEDTFATAWATGRALPLEQAIDDALTEDGVGQRKLP